MTRKTIATALAVLAWTCACALPAGAQTLADQLNTMGAQVQVLRKQQELNQALAQSAGTDLASLPRVVAVFGIEKRLQARLLLPSGMISTYEEGDTVRGTMKVAAITPKAVLVLVKTGNKTATLPLDFVAAATSTPGAGGVGPAGSPYGGAMPSGPLPPELLPQPPAVGTPIRPAAPAAVAAPAPAPAPAAPAAVSAAPAPTTTPTIAQPPVAAR